MQGRKPGHRGIEQLGRHGVFLEALEECVALAL
jgi:hypothetical protein